jgi:hypothetical protein
MQRSTTSVEIRDFFTGITEYAFSCRLGVADPTLVDYLSELLTRFVRNDEIFRVRTPTGKRIDQVAGMLSEAQSRQGPARRQVHRHIGDFTLFWTGVYPEAVERMRRSGAPDSLIDYRTHGKRAYHIASTIPSETEDVQNDLLQRLSHQFELCAYGLGEVRREWERREATEAQGLTLWIQRPR